MLLSFIKLNVESVKTFPAGAKNQIAEFYHQLDIHAISSFGARKGINN